MISLSFPHFKLTIRIVDAESGVDEFLWRWLEDAKVSQRLQEQYRPVQHPIQYPVLAIYGTINHLCHGWCTVGIQLVLVYCMQDMRIRN